MNELRQEICQIMADAGAGIPFERLMERFCAALRSHPEALGALSGSYRLQTLDTGFSLGFALSENSFRLLEANEKADVTISGKEQTLLSLVRRELHPAKALLTGKLTVKGSMAALNRFAQVL